MPARVAVVGGGLAGLSAAIRLAESGVDVDLFSVVPVKRSHSVCAQGGINAAKNMKGEGDHPDIHVDDTLFGGEFLADQPLVEQMCHKAPEIIDLLARMGVPFNRTPEGNLDFRRFGGTMHHRTAYAGATTGQQLLYALDEQVRRFEAEGRVAKYEHWEFLSLVLDDSQSCRGVVAMDAWTREVRAFAAGAVILCTGGPGLVFGKSTNSMINTGAAVSRAWQQGVHYANGEFIQVHPTSIPGADKLRLISESVRGEGGRVWVPKDPFDKRPAQSIPDAERDYFLERKYPKYGNLVPRDVATREIFQICVSEKRGIRGENQVYLDITPRQSGQSAEALERKLGGVLEIYRKFVGEDPVEVPMRIFPGMHYSMGGIYVSAATAGKEVAQMTNLPGCFAAGECEHQYHGANRLGANSLMSCIFGGFLAGSNAAQWAKSHAAEPEAALLDAERRRQSDLNDRVAKMSGGTENAYGLHRELGALMTAHCTVVRVNSELRDLLGKLAELEDRWQRVNVEDSSDVANQGLAFTRAVRDMILLAKAIAKGALLRNESRGAHCKPEFELPKLEKQQVGEPMDTESYRDYVAELERRNGAKFKRTGKQTGRPVAPEFNSYMQTWTAREREWNKATIARFVPGSEPEIEFRPTAITVAPPRPRIYS